MFKTVIPDYENEIRLLEKIGTAGFILGFGLKLGRPQFILNRFPPEWVTTYEELGYYFGDPMVYQSVAATGTKRWSDVKMDPRGVMTHAATYGLKFGATMSTKVGRNRSFLSVTRSDREITDDEIDLLYRKLELWAALFDRSLAKLTDKEKQVLQLVRDLETQAEVAKVLGVHLNTVKARLKTAQAKLGTANVTATILRAMELDLL